MRVEVVYCAAPHELDATSLVLPEGATLADALRAAGVALRHGLTEASLNVGVWGRGATLETVLRERDRVEIYRPLSVDPKEARRLRYRGQKEKGQVGEKRRA